VSASCPDETALSDCVNGVLQGEALVHVQDHLASCAACGAVVKALAEAVPPQGSADWTTIPDGRDQERGWLAPGTTMGRYLILELLGVGGMSVVYTAYDPTLDRRVALKLLRAEVDRALPARMMAEAQALARLSHPNVVTIHDVGTVRGQVFIAMELLDGGTLRRWLKSGERPWTEILARFAAAGRGLQAAHAASLIHGDFKPDNVLLSNAGAVRVTDFGLSRDSSARTAETETPAVMGTPAYMAPELFDGRPSDARADQFSFCVALYEALHGVRPYAGETPSAIVESARLGTPAAPVKQPPLPPRVRRALLRGLSADPEHRFPGMEGLLAALQLHPRRWRKRWLFLGGVAALAAALVGARGALQWRADACAASSDPELQAAWNQAAREKVRGALVGAGGAYGNDTWREVERGLDAYAARWREGKASSCRATVYDQQSDHQQAVRFACLERRLRQLRALVRVLSEKDPRIAEQAVQAVAELEGPEDCGDVEVLSRRAPPPEGAREAEEALAAGEAAVAAGRYPGAVAQLRGAAEAMDRLGYRTGQAEAWLLLGRALELETKFPEAERALHRAADAAEAGGEDLLAAQARIRLLSVLTDSRPASEDAERALHSAGAAAERLGPLKPQALEAELEHERGALLSARGDLTGALEANRRALSLRGEDSQGRGSSLAAVGVVLRRLGRFDEAAQMLRRAVEEREQRLGPDHPSVAAQLFNLANVLRTQNKLDEAEALLRRDLSICRRAFGENHPRTARALAGLAIVLASRGRPDLALPLFQSAVQAAEAADGPRSTQYALALSNLGSVLLDLGRAREAAEVQRRAVQVASQAFGAEHAETARTLGNLGEALVLSGQRAEARPVLQRSVALSEKALGPDHHQLTTALNASGFLALGEGQPGKARELFARSLSLSERAFGTEHPKVGLALQGLGLALLASGQSAQALPPLERAMALHQRDGVLPMVRARTQMGLAQALWAGGKDRAGAVALMRAAARDLAGETERTAAERWLAQRKEPR